MQILDLLSKYWIYFVATILAIWNVYLHIRSNKTKKKEKLLDAYGELTAIINEFQRGCFEILLVREAEINHRHHISSELERAEELINKTLPPARRDKLVEVKNLIDEVKNELTDIENLPDTAIDDERIAKMKLKLSTGEAITDAFDLEINSREMIISQNEEAQQILSDVILSNQMILRNKAIALNNLVTKTAGQINAAASWRLVGSTAVINSAEKLTSLSLKLSVSLINLLNEKREQLAIEDICNECFLSAWAEAEATVKKMRKEVI